MAQTYKDQTEAAAACCAGLEGLIDPDLFRALGDPNRVALLVRLGQSSRPTTVTEAAECCPVDLSVVSRHLAVLREAGVVRAAKRGPRGPLHGVPRPGRLLASPGRCPRRLLPPGRRRRPLPRFPGRNPMTRTPDEIKKAVRDRYARGGPARRHRRLLRPRRVRLLLRGPRRLRRLRLRRPGPRRGARGRPPGLAGLRQPHRHRRPAARGAGPGPRLGRRPGRVPRRPAGGPHRIRLRPRHDRRDARSGPGQPARRRGRQRRVPQGRDRGDPPARRRRGRDHLQLRHQPLHRQAGGVPARRTAC